MFQYLRHDLYRMNLTHSNGSYFLRAFLADDPPKIDPLNPDLHGLFDRLRELIEGENVDWSGSLGPWQGFCDALAKAAGSDTWLAYVLADMAAGITSSSERGRISSSLFDETINVADRARSARRRPNATSWWSKQADAIRSDLDRRGWLLLFLGWASCETVLALAETVRSEIDALDSWQLEELAQVVINPHRRPRSESNRLFTAKFAPFMDVFDWTSLGLVACYASDDFRHEYARTVPIESIERWPWMVGMVSEWLTSNSQGQPRSDLVPDLERLRLIAAKANGDLRLNTSEGPKSPKEWTVAVAREVLKSPAAYPAQVVALSDRHLSYELERSRRPVAAVARKAHWAAG